MFWAEEWHNLTYILRGSLSFQCGWIISYKEVGAEARKPNGRYLLKPQWEVAWMRRVGQVSCRGDSLSCTISMGWPRGFIIPLPPVAEEAEAIKLGSVVVISNRAKLKAPTPMSPICCLAQGASPLHPSIVWGVLVIQERRIFSEQLRQTQMQPDSPATVSCVHGSFPLCVS